ncbi:MAG: hypothetical protein ACAF41_32580 [Leptolyngbya sp. BL-A-14]
MDSVQYPFGKIHYLFRKADHAKWQRQESKRHILRSQLGFNDVVPTRPKPCTGCANYHGIAYGYTQEARTPLICGFHPYGWESDSACPDWCGAH